MKQISLAQSSFEIAKKTMRKQIFIVFGENDVAETLHGAMVRTNTPRGLHLALSRNVVPDIGLEKVRFDIEIENPHHEV